MGTQHALFAPIKENSFQIERRPLYRLNEGNRNSVFYIDNIKLVYTQKTRKFGCFSPAPSYARGDCEKRPRPYPGSRSWAAYTSNCTTTHLFDAAQHVLRNLVLMGSQKKNVRPASQRKKQQTVKNLNDKLVPQSGMNHGTEVGSAPVQRRREARGRRFPQARPRPRADSCWCSAWKKNQGDGSETKCRKSSEYRARRCREAAAGEQHGKAVGGSRTRGDGEGGGGTALGGEAAGGGAGAGSAVDGKESSPSNCKIHTHTRTHHWLTLLLCGFFRHLCQRLCRHKRWHKCRKNPHSKRVSQWCVRVCV